MSEDRGNCGTQALIEQNLDQRGDRGTLFADRGPSFASQIRDLSGNPLLPCRDEVAGQDKGQMYGSTDTSTAFVRNAVNGTFEPADSKSKKAFWTRKKTGIVAGATAGLGLLAVAGFFAVKALTPHPVTVPSVPVVPVVAAAPKPSSMSANEIYKSVSPSVVTLTIKASALCVNNEKFDIIDPYGDEDDSPILALPDDNDTPVLYQKGEAKSQVTAILIIDGHKIPAIVKMYKTMPIVIPTDSDGNPLKKNGQMMIVPCNFKKYETTATGTGFMVAPDIVATNWHVVSDKATGDRSFSGGTAQVTDKQGKFEITDKPIAFDKEHDLALLYVPGTNATPLKMRTDYATLKVGEQVYAIGSPLGMSGSLMEGIISADQLRDKTYLQHTARLDHGNSGGPLVDANGQVLGVNSAHMGNGAINLAVAVQFVQDILSRPTTQQKIAELAKAAAPAF